MKRICALLLALVILLLPEVAFASNISPPAANMTHVYIVFGVLVIAAVLFFTEWIPLAVTSILVPCALSTCGVITVQEAWVSFGDTSILTIVGLFMLGEATFATGFAQRVATMIISKAGSSETRLLVLSILLIAFMSAFLNNAGVTAITLPMLISIARKAHLSPRAFCCPRPMRPPSAAAYRSWDRLRAWWPTAFWPKWPRNTVSSPFLNLPGTAFP